MVANLKAEITGALNSVRAFADEMKAGTPDPNRLENLMSDMRKAAGDVEKAALKATDWQSWLQAYDPNDYIPFGPRELHTHPGDSAVPVWPAPLFLTIGWRCPTRGMPHIPT